MSEPHENRRLDETMRWKFGYAILGLLAWIDMKHGLDISKFTNVQLLALLVNTCFACSLILSDRRLLFSTTAFHA